MYIYLISTVTKYASNGGIIFKIKSIEV